MASCPNCKEGALSHTLLADALPAHGCKSCGGVFLSLIAYRRWSETHPSGASPAEPADSSIEIEDSAKALGCPKCEGIMTKYRIASDVGNRIDYCEHCEEVWLDEGEWELVERLAGSGHLTNILTQPWQGKITKDVLEAMETKRMRNTLGDDYDYFEKFHSWLNAHDARDSLLAHLRRK